MVFNPYVARHVLFELEDADFAAEVSDAQLIPTVTIANWQGLTPPSQYSDAGPATWVCTITLAQDYDEALSLATFLFDHEGEKVPMSFEPRAGGTAFTADVTIVPGTIGGPVNSYAEATVTLPAQKKPLKTPVTP